MCILVVIRDRVEGWPLVVGANRDEYRDRPWEPPRRDGPVLAPRDLRAGGSWLALHDSGLLVALTNRPEPGPDPARPSRGLLVMDLAREGSVGAARERLRDELARERRNAFRVLIADAEQAWLCAHPGSGGAPCDETPVPPGLHTLTNLRGLDELDHLGALDELDPPPGAALDDVLARLRKALATHEDRGPRGRDAICKHGADRGTLSSSIVAVGEAARFWFAPGPPCELDLVETEATRS